MNDLAAAYSLSFKLGNNLLLCKFSASNSQPFSNLEGTNTHTRTEIEIYIYIYIDIDIDIDIDIESSKFWKNFFSLQRPIYC